MVFSPNESHHFFHNNHPLTDNKEKHADIVDQWPWARGVLVCVCVPVSTWLQPCELIGCLYLDVSSGSVHIVTVSMAVSLLISPNTPTHSPFACVRACVRFRHIIISLNAVTFTLMSFHFSAINIKKQSCLKIPDVHPCVPEHEWSSWALTAPWNSASRASTGTDPVFFLLRPLFSHPFYSSHLCTLRQKEVFSLRGAQEIVWFGVWGKSLSSPPLKEFSNTRDPSYCTLFLYVCTVMSPCCAFPCMQGDITAQWQCVFLMIVLMCVYLCQYITLACQLGCASAVERSSESDHEGYFWL